MKILKKNNEVLKNVSLNDYVLKNVFFSYGIVKIKKKYGIYDFFNEKFIIEPIHEKIKIKENNKKLNLNNFVLKNKTRTLSVVVKDKEILNINEEW